jgi:hypothetical protein
MFETSKLLAMTTFAILLVGCGDSSISTLTDETINGNSAPTLYLTASESIIENTPAIITSQVADSDGHVNSYLWAQTAGKSVSINDFTSSELTFYSPIIEADTTSQIMATVTTGETTELVTTTIEGEIITFSLTITDNDGAQNLESISLLVTNNQYLPSVILDEDIAQNELTKISIESTATVDEGELTYSWEVIDSDEIILDAYDTQNITFTSPNVNVDTSYTIKLIATSDTGLTQSDTINILVLNNPDALILSPKIGLVIDENDTVTLTSSVEVNGASSYLWSQISGSTMEISDLTSSELIFTAPLVNSDSTSEFTAIGSNYIPETSTIEGQTISFSVIVTNKIGVETSEIITIVVLNNPDLPDVELGDNLTFPELTEVTIESSVELDNGTTSYLWSVVDSDLITLDITDAESLSFSSPDVDSDTWFTFRLTVTSSTGVSQSDTINVLVENVPITPQISAGSNITVTEGTLVTLSGSSSDTDGYVISYSWTQLSGLEVILDNPLTPVPSFTAPETDETLMLSFELTISDDEQNISTDIVLVQTNPLPTTILNDTGYIQCLNLNDNTLSSCNNSEFPSQDGDHGIDALSESDDYIKVGSGKSGFDFTKISAAGNTLPDNSTEWACVMDNITNLIWEVKTEFGPFNAGSNLYNLADGRSYVDEYNLNNVCGKSDWRLPSFLELQNIINFTVNEGEIDTLLFPFITNSIFLTNTIGNPAGDTIMTISLSNHEQLPSSVNNQHNVILVRK